MAFPKALRRLLEELEKLPGVGPRTAERLAFHLLYAHPQRAAGLEQALGEARESVHACGECNQLTDSDPCAICADPSRQRERVLVVGQPRDVEVMEKAGWRGLYHVLTGPLKPGARDDGALGQLSARVRSGGIEEVVLGTNPDFEGDGTAMRVSESLAALGSSAPRVSRLARGLPTGSALEYANPAVIAEAIEERRSVSWSQEKGAES